MLCPNSKNAILRSCGAGIAAVDDLMINNERIFCAIRPPGHHAETVKAMGFCFINNIAVAAKYLQKKYEVKKVAIIDFDVLMETGHKRFFIMIKQFYMDRHMNFLYFQAQVQLKKKGLATYLMLP